MTGSMTFDDVVEEFSQSVGVEKARDMVERAAETVGAEEPPYSHREVVDICEVITEEYGGYVAIIARDLLVEKQAENRFYTLLESIPDPAVVVTYTDDAPLIRKANSAFESTFGYTNETLVDKSLNEFIVPPDESEQACMLDEQLLSGEELEYEVQRVTADGETRDFLLRGITRRTDRGSVECYAIYTDITDRKERERELERQNERLDQFASVVSHDLRNPLNVASGHLELARETGEAAHLDAVADAHERMERLIERILTLARKGQTVGESERCDLSALAERAWGAVQTAPATLVGSETLEEVMGDPERILELFENLFRNSIEHGGSDVTVTVGMCADDAGFFVDDDGSGIPPDDRAAVRKHGFSTSDDGTGLGLAIVDSIADAHGWALEITASETGGARIEIRDLDRPEER